MRDVFFYLFNTSNCFWPWTWPLGSQSKPLFQFLAGRDLKKSLIPQTKLSSHPQSANSLSGFWLLFTIQYILKKKKKRHCALDFSCSSFPQKCVTLWNEKGSWMVFHVDFKALVCCVCALLTLTHRLLQKHPTPLFFASASARTGTSSLCFMCVSRAKYVTIWSMYVTFEFTSLSYI